MLCFVNREQANPNLPERRPLSYNERLLATGQVLPYFIWPNVNPFRRARSLLDAVIEPGKADQIVDGSLQVAREAFRLARQQYEGIYDVQRSLALEPFEARFLAQRRAPNRWIIDLSKSENYLIHPQNYFHVANPEDRLFVPEEYTPLFVRKGGICNCKRRIRPFSFKGVETVSSTSVLAFDGGMKTSQDCLPERR